MFGARRVRGRCAAVAAVALAAALLAIRTPPAAPQSTGLTITQQVSTRLVAPGSPVTFTITLTAGAQPVDVVHVDTLPRRPEALDGTGDTYTSVTTTQGTCAIAPGIEPDTPNGPFTTVLSCDVGPLAPGASVVITAVATMTLPADFFVLADDVQTNDIVNVDAPPVVTGSRRAKVTGLPKGCATGDIPLTVTAPPGPKARSVEAYASLPESNGSGIDTVMWKAAAGGSRLKASVPASKIALMQTTMGNERVKFDVGYKLHVIVHRRNAAALKTTIVFKTCAQPLRGFDLG